MWIGGDGVMEEWTLLNLIEKKIVQDFGTARFE
jgi:hypothetical protein